MWKTQDFTLADPPKKAASGRAHAAESMTGRSRKYEPGYATDSAAYAGGKWQKHGSVAG